MLHLDRQNVFEGNDTRLIGSVCVEAELEQDHVNLKFSVRSVDKSNGATPKKVKRTEA